MKTCARCTSEGPFYKDRSRPDGLDKYCRVCRKSMVAARNESPEVRQRNRDNAAARRAATPDEVRRIRRESAKRVRERDPVTARAKGRAAHFATPVVKRKARAAARNAIRDGRLTREPCVVCGDAKSQAHHDDYSKPLDVVWLCQTHHTARHQKLNDQGNLRT